MVLQKITILSLQFAIFVVAWFAYKTSNSFRCACHKLQDTFPLSKASGVLISCNLALLLFSSAYVWRKYLYLPFASKQLHYISATFVFAWSIVHSVANYINYSKLPNKNVSFTWGTGYTGLFLLLCLVVSFVISTKQLREKYFHKFIVFHYVCFLVFLIFLYIHQSFCFYKTDRNTCPPPLSFLITMLPVLLVFWDLGEKYMVNNFVPISDIVIHTHNLLELKLLLPKYYAGKTIRLNCPEISYFEWHPFATSLYDDNSIVTSVFFKIRGNWTKRFASKIGLVVGQKTGTVTALPTVYPHLRLTGPYYGISTTLSNSIVHHKQPTIIITTGIGLTTFSYLLSQLADLPNQLDFKLLLVITTKQPDDIRWFLPVLHKIKTHDNFSLAIYFTQFGSLIDFPIPFHLGRPDFSNLLETNLVTSNFSQHTHVYVYHSGIKKVSQTLQRLCRNNPVYCFVNVD